MERCASARYIGAQLPWLRVVKRLVCLQMEVGIEDCLHIEFEYSKGKYHLADTVVGKIYFLLVRIRLKHMEIEIRRRETTGAYAL
jgi:Vacuolar protein sorting-associated protein 26